MLPGVSVIIPNWNGTVLLEALLVSLKSQDSVREVIVVDNGSSDNSVQVARNAGARVVELPTNAGFAAAVNRGIREAAADWLLILNNDVELTGGWVKTLWAEALARSAWFATGKLLDAQHRGRIDATYDAVCAGGTAWRCGTGRADAPVWNIPKPISFAPFTAYLVRKDLFGRIGFLSESFESYLEDVEFGIRCSIGGYFGVYVPSVVAYHRGSATLGKWHPDTVRRIARNQVLLVALHYPSGWLRRWGWKTVVAQGLWGLVALRHGTAWPWVQGKLAGLRLFRSARRVGPDALYPILERSENEIRELQKQTGWDLYWRLYFALS